MLDGILYIKKIFLEKFDNFKFSLKNEFENLLKFGIIVKNNLIFFLNIFIEEIFKNYNVICNVLDFENNFYFEIDNIEKWGLLFCVDLDSNLVAFLNFEEFNYLLGFLYLEFKNFGWIDVVKIKRNIKK